jgi:starvation-inducible DNA-binding protein
MPTATKHTTYKTGINLSEETREKLIELLNARLADSLDLSTQCKQAHWNVKGIHFYQLHLLFDKVAEHVEGYVDLVAERATALGGIAMGTARVAAKFSALPEYDLNAVTGEEHLKALSKNLAKYGNLIRKAIDEADDLGDKGTSDLFTQIIREADEDLYFLESHLDAKDIS